MCSLSWLYQSHSYEIYFNRDEKKTRRRATPPAVFTNRGTRFICPRDADAGGTWIVSNEHGVTLALLNLWDSSSVLPQTYTLSRGVLLAEQLSDAHSALGAVDTLKRANLQAYGDFTLAVFDLEQRDAPLLMRWNAGQLRELPTQKPVCSSSFMPEVVIPAREKSFACLANQEAQTLWNWHCAEKNPTAFTVRMLRPDAQTWSCSRILVHPKGIHWLYLEELPELSTIPIAHELQFTR